MHRPNAPATTIMIRNTMSISIDDVHDPVDDKIPYKDNITSSILMRIMK